MIPTPEQLAAASEFLKRSPWEITSSGVRELAALLASREGELRRDLLKAQVELKDWKDRAYEASSLAASSAEREAKMLSALQEAGCLFRANSDLCGRGAEPQCSRCAVVFPAKPSEMAKMCALRINRPCEKNELDQRLCQYCFKPYVAPEKPL